jgi:hypothetical protein
MQDLLQNLSTEYWTGMLSKSLQQIAREGHGALAWLSTLLAA